MLAAPFVLAAGAAASWYLLQATVLTIAVAPRDGTEPELIKAYADTLEAGNESVRLRILSFDDVRESAVDRIELLNADSKHQQRLVSRI